jgi:hypothetical protein
MQFKAIMERNISLPTLVSEIRTVFRLVYIIGDIENYVASSADDGQHSGPYLGGWGGLRVQTF